MEILNDYDVIKNDGRIEPFMESKVRGSIIYAGGSCQEADEITNLLGVWVTKNATDNKIKTSELRKKLIELLREKNPDAAESYESYKKE